MTKKTITIDRVEDLQVGDVATFKIEGREYTGPVYGDENGNLTFAAYTIRWADGRPGVLDAHVFVSAIREVPELPTEPLSVITNVVAESGNEYEFAVLASNGAWNGVTSDGVTRWLLPSQITSFDLAKVVPA